MQGVGFRYFAIQAAARTGVVGTVRNLEDGTVEAIAEGTPSSVSDFRAQLERGPSYARVTSVDEIEMPVSGRHTGFNVLY